MVLRDRYIQWDSSDAMLLPEYKYLPKKSNRSALLTWAYTLKFGCLASVIDRSVCTRFSSMTVSVCVCPLCRPYIRIPIHWSRCICVQFCRLWTTNIDGSVQVPVAPPPAVADAYQAHTNVAISTALAVFFFCVYNLGARFAAVTSD